MASAYNNNVSETPVFYRVVLQHLWDPKGAVGSEGCGGIRRVRQLAFGCEIN